MRPLILKMSISADGFVAGPGGEIDWLFRSMDEGALLWIHDTLRQAGVHIMGSLTFHDMAAYWPTSTDLLAALMNEIPKVVFSRKGSVDLSNTGLRTRAIRDKSRLDSEKGIHPSGTISPAAASWTGARVAGGDMEIEIARLKGEDGNPLLAHGGAGFARSLVRSGLIDEYRLLVHPVVLGRGLPLFTELKTPMDLRLERSTAFKSGIVANVYRPVYE
jgi:dihydrofolate reductase